MRKSAITSLPENYEKYVSLVDDLTLNVAFDKHFTEIQNLNLDILNELGDRTYAPEKWTVREIMQHLVDWERIFSYRSIVYARQDGSVTLGHDENILAKNSKANDRKLEEIIEDFLFARHSTQSLFKSFDEENLQSIGQNWNSEISVLALGFIIVGHQIHHFNVIKERYLPILGKEVNLLKGGNFKCAAR